MSDLDGIPGGWQESTVGQLCKTIYRYPTFYGMEKVSTGVPVVRGEHLKNYRISEDFEDFWFVSEDYAANFPKTFLELDDVVMSVRGTVGNFALVHRSHVGSQISPNLIRISADAKKVDRRYFFYSLGLLVGKLLAASVQSQALPALSAGDIKALQVALPNSLEEQRKIADILSTWDEAIEQQTRLLKLKCERKRGLMQQLLTGKVRFKEFEGLEWPNLPINKVAKEVSQRNKSASDLPVLSCTKHKGLVDSLSYFGKQVYSKDTST